jgi:hypothetical protein
MSYDLFFKPRSERFSLDSFLGFLRSVPRFKFEEDRILYENEDTEVYFVLHCDPEGFGDSVEFPIHVAINYLRPTIFIMEISLVLTELVEKFGFIVSDDQIEGMGEGNFDPQKLVRAWIHCNQLSIRSFPGAKQSFSMPTSKLGYIWRWNMFKGSLQEELGEASYVPRIMTFAVEGELKSAVCWGDGHPWVFPRVDRVLVIRKELAPSGLIGTTEDAVMVSRESVLQVLAPYGKVRGDGTFVTDYSHPPPAVVEFVKSLPVESKKLEGIAIEGILDRELMDFSTED